MAFSSVEATQKNLEKYDYICSENIATVAFLAHATQKPVLVEGPAGVGKTELAKAVARALDRRLIRLQCYEGLDEAKALYEWEYAKQLLYTQMIKGKINDVISGSNSLSDAVDRIPWEERKSLESHFTERIESARRLLLQNPRPAGENIKKIGSHDQHLTDLGETSFASLTQKEVEELREVIKQLVRKLVEKVLSEADIDYGAATDYGLTLRLFKKHYMDVLNKKTTLIIIGDGRSNYSNPEVEILDEMRDRCRRLIWLNPETRQFWYSGDSEMRTYEGSCHEVRPCRNLNQLLDFIKDLVL